MLIRLVILMCAFVLSICNAEAHRTHTPHKSHLVKKTVKHKTMRKKQKATRASNHRDGTASWYGAAHHGRLTASGERFNMNSLTAAHRSLPFGTRLLVTNKDTGKSVTVRVTDRGPYVGGRILDLSRAAASRLGMLKTGTAKISMVVLNAVDIDDVDKPEQQNLIARNFKRHSSRGH